MSTLRLTMVQAPGRFLAIQYAEPNLRTIAGQWSNC